MKIHHEGDYRARRAAEYPPIAEQLDALWHAMQAGVLPMVPAFYEPIAAVKARFQKPTGKGKP